MATETMVTPTVTVRTFGLAYRERLVGLMNLLGSVQQPVARYVETAFTVVQKQRLLQQLKSARKAPLAAPTDRPAGTQPGLNPTGVTLEFGALWNPDVPAAIPPLSGVLCALKLSQPALVSIVENHDRGGVVSALPGNIISAVFDAAYIDPSVIITGIVLSNGVVKITFQGGELETARRISGPWTSTGNSSGIYSAAVGQAQEFFRVRRL